MIFRWSRYFVQTTPCRHILELGIKNTFLVNTKHIKIEMVRFYAPAMRCELKTKSINSNESLVYCVMRDENGPYGSKVALQGEKWFSPIYYTKRYGFNIG